MNVAGVMDLFMVLIMIICSKKWVLNRILKFLYSFFEKCFEIEKQIYNKILFKKKKTAK
jgi:hypothetical protein